MSTTSNTPETDANVAWNAERYHLINMCDAHIARSLETRLTAALAEVEWLSLKYKITQECYAIAVKDPTTLQQENEKLVADRARLDWLELAHHRPEWLMNLSQDARQEIDKAMKDYHSTLTKEQK